MLIGVGLTAGLTYIQYQSVLDRTIKERIADLEVIRLTLYDPIIYSRVYLAYPELKSTLVKRAAQSSPDIIFLRILNSEGKVLVSNLGEEVGRVFQDLPRFSAEPSLRKREWQGKPILDISMRGVATENLWMGINLKPIQQQALEPTVVIGVTLFFGIVLIALILVLLLERIILNPLLKLHRGMEEIRKGNLDVRVEVKSKTEIGELVTTFNKMAEDLKKSQAALEEAKAVLEIKVRARTKELKELTESLEEQVKKRTKELQERIEELERFRRLTVGRELKMIELKKEIAQLKAKLNKEKSKL